MLAVFAHGLCCKNCVALWRIEPGDAVSLLAFAQCVFRSTRTSAVLFENRCHFTLMESIPTSAILQVAALHGRAVGLASFSDSIFLVLLIQETY